MFHNNYSNGLSPRLGDYAALFSGRSTAGVPPIFPNELQSSLVPQRANGSSTPTFTRATTAYQTDFEGKLNLCLSGEARFQGARRVANLVATTSEDFTNGAWVNNVGGTGTATTVTPGFTDPLGSSTAYRLQANRGASDTGADYSFIRNTIGAVTGHTYVNSVWIKSNTGSSQVVTVRGVAAGTVTATTTWQRLSANVGAAASIDLGTVGGLGHTQSVDILIWRAQAEDVTGQTNQNPSEYVSVGVLSAPYPQTMAGGEISATGADGVGYSRYLNGNTVASNVVTTALGAAINSSEAACAGGVTAGVVDASGPLGYLAEGARTNRCLFSQTWENAAWVASNVTVADNTAVAPNGTSTAATLTATAGNGTVIQDLGVVASASKTGGLWIKRKTGTGNIDLTMDGGTGWTTVTVTAAWTRVSKNQTLADEDFGIRIVTSGDAVYVWNGQVETAAFLSSDIPTTTVAVARNADVDQYVSASNVPTNNFTVYGETAFPVVPTAASYYLWSTYVDANNSTSVLWDGTNLIARKRIGGANNDATIALTPTAATVFKWAATFSSTGTQIYKNGSAGTADATGTACQIGTNFQEGADGNGAGQPYASTRNRRIYGAVISAARLQVMTT